VQYQLLCFCDWSRKLLYAECGEAWSTVRACNLTAGDCTLRLNRSQCVRDLHFDTDSNTLYWIELNMVMSQRASTKRPQFVKSVLTVSGVYNQLFLQTVMQYCT